MVYAKLAVRWRQFHEAPAMQQWNCDVTTLVDIQNTWFHWLYSNNEGFIDHRASQWNRHCHSTTSKPSLLSYNQWTFTVILQAVKPSFLSYTTSETFTVILKQWNLSQLSATMQSCLAFLFVLSLNCKCMALNVNWPVLWWLKWVKWLGNRQMIGERLPWELCNKTCSQ